MTDGRVGTDQLLVKATRSLMPVLVAASTTLSKGDKSMVAWPLSHRWNTTSVVPALSPPYWGLPAGLYVAFLSLKPHVRKTFRPASLAAARPSSTSVWFWARGQRAAAFWAHWWRGGGRGPAHVVEGEVVGIAAGEEEVVAIELEFGALGRHESRGRLWHGGQHGAGGQQTERGGGPHFGGGAGASSGAAGISSNDVSRAACA